MHAIAPLAGIVGLVLVAGAIGVTSWGCLYWMLGPLDREAKKRRFPSQFSLADLLSLFVLVQVPIGGVKWATATEEFQAPAVVISIVLGAIAIVIWWVCVQTLSRAGVHIVWQRCVVLLVVLPVGYVGTIAVLVVPAVAVGCLVDGHSLYAEGLVLAEAIVVCIIYVLGRVSRRIVALANERQAAETSELVQ
jgi:hypothetical protein